MLEFFDDVDLPDPLAVDAGIIEITRVGIAQNHATSTSRLMLNSFEERVPVPDVTHALKGRP